MDRNEEYKSLLEELDETPLKLDFTFERALQKRREHRHHVHKAVFAPMGTFAAVFAVFVLLVNVSPTFAYAAGRVPVLRDLAKFVAMSSSLSAAVENEYVQPMDQEQTANGITAKIEYVIVDQKQLNIFYTLDSEVYSAMDATPDLRGADGEYLNGCSIGSGGWDVENGKLRKITVDFSSGTMPDTVMLRLKIRDNGALTKEATAPPSDANVLTEYEYEEPVFIAELNFTLKLDPNFTEKGERIELNKSFALDGQIFTLTAAEIYPTHMRFTFDDSERNTAWMVGLEFYVENEKGERFEGISNGITAFGKLDSPMMATYMLESAFFSNSKHLTLHITNVVWLDKDMEKVRVDLENKTLESYPAGVKFELATRKTNGWVVVFSAPVIKENSAYQLWGWSYFDSEDKEHDLNGMSSSDGGYYDFEKNVFVELPGRFIEQFNLINYPYDEIWLCPSYSSRVMLDTPINIEIK